MFKQYNEFLMVDETGDVIKLETVDSMGRVTKEYHPKKYDNGNGYDYISTNWKGKPWQKSVHIIVAELFVSGKSDVNKEVHHIDGNKKNNNASNLEWISTKKHHGYGSSALEHATKTKIARYGKPYYLDNGIEKLYFESMKQGADFLNVSRTAIRLVLKGENKTVKGYKAFYSQGETNVHN